jgi:hypothetical protein
LYRVPFIVVPAVLASSMNLIHLLGCILEKKSCKHRRALQHIDIIMSSHHPKESMPNPEDLICLRFKYHTTLSDMTFVQSLPSKWAILPSPIHAIDTPKHPRKSSSCILCHDSSSVLFIWGSQIVFSKHCHNCPAKTCPWFQSMSTQPCVDSPHLYHMELHRQYTVRQPCAFLNR